jgi:hypothetical protein
MDLLLNEITAETTHPECLRVTATTETRAAEDPSV